MGRVAGPEPGAGARHAVRRDHERQVGAEPEQPFRGLQPDAEPPGRAEPARREPVAGARVVHQLELDLAALAPDQAEDLPLRQQEAMLLVLVGDRHEIGQHHAAARGLEAGLEHVGVREVPPRGLKGLRRCYPPAPRGRVEDGGEQRRAVAARPAQPVDRAAPADERGGAAVADHGVVSDGVRNVHAG